MFLLLIAHAHAATWVVDAGGGGDATTVQDGIALAATGDTVLVLPGTYVEDVDFEARTFHLEGDGSSTTFLIGTGTGPVVRIDSGEGPGTAITGFTIQGGDATSSAETGGAGGGLYSLGVPLYAEDLVFIENVATYGGGALVGQSEDIEVLGSVFSGNRARYGAGLYVLEGTATVQDCEFAGNLADLDVSSGAGGGLIVLGASVDASNLVFLGNGAVDAGGGLYAAESAAVGCRFCSFTEGSAELGGGLYSTSASISLTSALVDNNIGSGGGGGVMSAGGSTLTLYGATFEANDAAFGGAVLVSDSTATGSFVQAVDNTAGGGGAFYVQQSSLALTNSLLAANVAETANGGAIAFDQGTGELDAVIFSNNQGYSGGAVHVNGTSVATLANVTLVEGRSSGSAGGIRVSDGGVLDLNSSIVAYSTEGSGVSASTSAVVSLRYTDFWTNTNGDVSGGIANPVGANGNIAENPLFASFAQDGDWLDDLHLATGSPCIDAGDPTRLDADGSTADMGAYGGPYGAGWDDVDLDADGVTSAEGDCDDADADTYPGAEDGCDDIDQDCDGVAEEGCDSGTTPGDDTGPVDTDTPTPDDSGTPTADDSGKGGGGGGGDGCGCTNVSGAAPAWAAALLGLVVLRGRRARGGR